MTKKTKKPSVVILILVAALITVAVILTLFGVDSDVNQRNIELLNSYGWLVEEQPCETAVVTIPENFDNIYEEYNKIAKESGFDLSVHRGARVTRYSYKVLNHEESPEGLIRANVFVSKKGIAAADITSLEIGGFTSPINDTTKQTQSTQ